ncbi:MAG: hypothetical protein QF745_01510, partial [Planctomycetota bacterium]|nr:hypothetical protein [Planctomycetota bacterium]
MTDPEPADQADFTSTNAARRSRFTFGGNKQRPGSEMPKLPLDGLNGFVMVQGQDGSSERHRKLTPQDAQFSQQGATLLKESQNLQGSYRELLKEKEAWQQQKDHMDAVRKSELLKAREIWSQSAMNKQGQPSAPPGPAQMRFLVESQDKKIEELKDMMMRFTYDTKSSLEFLAQSQKGNEVGFKHVGAKLRQIEGGVEQLASKTEQIESAWEAWTEEDGLEPCAEGDDDYDDDWSGWDGGDPDQNDGGAPDG